MSSDRRAVLILIVLGAAGVLVRLFAGSPGAPGAVAYRSARAPRSSLDSVAARAGRLARPLRRGETIDLDFASAEEITRLPRVGPALAARIVADRDTNGPFRSLEGLDRVSGIGPAVLGAVKLYVTFSGREPGAVWPGAGGAPPGRLSAPGSRLSTDRRSPLLGPDPPDPSIRRSGDPPIRQGKSGGRRTGEREHRKRPRT